MNNLVIFASNNFIKKISLTMKAQVLIQYLFSLIHTSQWLFSWLAGLSPAHPIPSILTTPFLQDCPAVPHPTPEALPSSHHSVTLASQTVSVQQHVKGFPFLCCIYSSHILHLAKLYSCLRSDKGHYFFWVVFCDTPVTQMTLPHHTVHYHNN